VSEHKAKVLIIDDQLSEVKMAKVALEIANYEVIHAYNGKEGVEKAKQEKPDVIILDIMMSVKDGFKTADVLRNDLDCCMIPIIILTAYGDISSPLLDIRGAFNFYPGVGYLEKTFDTNVLLRRVEEMVARRWGATNKKKEIQEVNL